MKRQELMKSSIDSLLLCLLAERPMYGYQIIKDLEERSQGYFRFKEGTLYPALHRLETRGLIIGTWQLLSNGRQRKYYRITDKGLAVVGESRSRWREFSDAVNLIMQPVNI